MQWFKYFKLSNTLTINLEELYLGCQTSDSPPNTLSLLSVTSHCILLDLAFISKTCKPLTDQGTQTKSSHEESDIQQSDHDTDEERSDIEGMSYYICIMLSIYHKRLHHW